MKTDLTEIVIAAQNNDQRAFEALYNLTKDSSYFVAFSITQNENDALDIMQDSYLKVFNSIKQLKNPDAFESWLNRIVANTAKNYIAKKKPMLFDDIETLSNEVFEEAELNWDYLPEQSADSKETSRLLIEIIGRLSEEKRLCILMYYYQEMSVSEIAEALQLPVTTVKYKLLAARSDIKKEVEKLEKDGTKLYALFPFILFPAQFKNVEKEFALYHPSPAFDAVYNTVKFTAATASATAKTGLFTTLAGKLVIAVSAVVLVGGITAAILASFNSYNPTTQNNVGTTTAQSNANAELLTSEQAIEKMRSVGTNEAAFVLDGVAYTLPCPLQQFLDNGWVNAGWMNKGGESDTFETEKPWPDRENDVWLKRSDGVHPDSILHLRVNNTTQDRIALSQCDVEFFEIHMHILEPNDNSELILSGGLVFNQDVTTQKVTQTCKTPDSQQSVYYCPDTASDLTARYNIIEYPSLTLYVNEDPNDINQYNYHMCKIFAQEGE